MKRVAFLFAVMLLAGCSWFGGQRQHENAMACGVSFAVPFAGGHVAASSMLPAPVTAELPDGALVIGTQHKRGADLVLTLRRVDPDCQTYRLASVRVRAGKFGTIDTVVATPQAELLLGGSDGRHELVGRVLATGRIDRTFGYGGWTRLAPHEKPISGMPPAVFTATSIAVGSSGSIFVGGNDGGPHCCVRDFVSELRPNGALVRTRFLPTFGGSYAADVFASRDGSVYALGQYEQSGCGDPSIVRLRPDGAFDTRFDTAIQRTIKRVAGRPKLRFTPTLVPEGGSGRFLLVGGLDRTCVPGAAPRHASGGVAVAVQPSGQIDRSYGHDGVAHFSSPSFAFDGPVALRLSSGVVLAAAFGYTANGRRNAVLLRALRSSGAIDRNVIPRLPLHGPGRSLYGSVSLLPRSPDRAWLVIGLPEEIDVTPVSVS